jgi:membrane protein implicated in regulation of membrane protease activity
VVPVLVVSYGLIGGVWLTFIGRRGSLLSLLLSVVIAILIVAYYNKRKKEASRENADEQNSSGLSDVEQEK